LVPNRDVFEDIMSRPDLSEAKDRARGPIFKKPYEKLRKILG